MQLSLIIRDTIRTELVSFRTEKRKEMKAELKKTKVIIFNRDQNHDVRGAERLNLSFWGVYGSYSVKVVMYFSITTADLFLVVSSTHDPATKHTPLPKKKLQVGRLYWVVLLATVE